MIVHTSGMYLLAFLLLKIMTIVIYLFYDKLFCEICDSQTFVEFVLNLYKYFCITAVLYTFLKELQLLDSFSVFLSAFWILIMASKMRVILPSLVWSLNLIKQTPHSII